MILLRTVDTFLYFVTVDTDKEMTVNNQLEAI